MTGRADGDIVRLDAEDPPRRAGIGWLVVAFFVGAVAWSAFHLVGYMWATVACSVPERLLIGATALVAACATSAAMWHERRAMRALRDQRDRGNAVAATDWFIATSGLYLNAFFLAAIALTGLSVLFLGGCE